MFWSQPNPCENIIARGPPPEIFTLLRLRIMNRQLAQRRARRRTRAARSNLDLAAELDDAVGRQLEELHRGLGVAKHPREQLLAPARHAGAGCRQEGLPREEEAGLHQVELGTALAKSRERRRNVDFVHEPVMEHDAVKALTLVRAGDPLGL